jgi:hypothetical protein
MQGKSSMAAKRNALIISGLLILAVAFSIGRISKEQGATSQASRPQTNEVQEHSSPTALPLTDQRPAENFAQTRSNVKAQLFAEYRCQKSSCNMSPFLAENENEALWLRQRGYPSEQQREEVKRLPIVELKSRSEKGDLIAASLYGERLMEEGDWTKPYPLLLEAANKGSLYALYALSYRSLNHPKHPDYISARAYLRLAYLAGDYKATIQLTQTAPHMNGQAEQLLIDEYAADKYRNLMKYRSYPRPPSKF